MGVKVWISQWDDDYWLMWETKPMYSNAAGPIEITNETFEYIREAEKAFNAAQNILSELEYEWKYPDE